VEAPCAIGGALQSIGKQVICSHDDIDNNYSVFDNNYSVFVRAWPFTDNCAACPGEQCHFWDYKWGYASIQTIVYHLNDHHRWTRSQIADWVATVEPISSEEVKASEESPSLRRSPRPAPCAS
jgi:hypothetical protein